MHIFFKKNKIGFYKLKNKSLGGKKCFELHSKTFITRGKKVGKLKSPAGGIASQKTLKDKQLGPFYNPKIQRKIQQNISKNKGSYIFKNVGYDTKAEMEFAMNIYYQIEELKLWKNYQFIIGRKRIDFYIEKFKCFIEYHPYCRNGTHADYYKNRRKILNDGGFKDFNLLVIK